MHLDWHRAHAIIMSMAGKGFLIGLILFWQASVGAQWMREPLRVQDSAYTKFFNQKMNSWFEQNLYSFSAQFKELEKNLLQSFLKNQKNLGLQEKDYFLRAFSYGIQFPPTPKGAVQKLYSFEIFNTLGDSEIKEKVLILAEKSTFLKRQDLSQADILGWKWFSEQNRFSVLLFKKDLSRMSFDFIPEVLKAEMQGPGILEIHLHNKKPQIFVIKLGVKTSDSCLGLMPGQHLQKDQIFSDKGKLLLCHSIRFEPEAWGGVAKNITAEFQKAFNLQPGIIQHEARHASFYYP